MIHCPGAISLGGKPNFSSPLLPDRHSYRLQHMRSHKSLLALCLILCALPISIATAFDTPCASNSPRVPIPGSFSENLGTTRPSDQEVADAGAAYVTILMSGTLNGLGCGPCDYSGCSGQIFFDPGGTSLPTSATVTQGSNSEYVATYTADGGAGAEGWVSCSPCVYPL